MIADSKVNQTIQHDAYSKAVDYYSKINELTITFPHIGRMGYDPESDYGRLDREVQDYYNYVTLLLGFYERIYMLYQRKWIDKETWDSWERWLVDAFIPGPHFDVVWRNERSYFTKKFTEFVDSHVDSIRASRPPKGSRTGPPSR